MRLARFRRGDDVGIGVVEGDHLYVLDLGTTALGAILRNAGGAAAIREAADRRAARVLLSEVGLVAPIDDPGKVVAIGLNYKDHAAEGGVKVPAEPLVFAKFPSSIIGPGSSIQIDSSLTEAVDIEAELAVVIGTTAREIPRHAARSHVFGYTCLNDVSARDLQRSDSQWVRAKSLDTFCPIGPWIVTEDEIPHPNELGIRSSINGEALQTASTADMVFDVDDLVSRLSYSFTLEPGDVIATGTPPGVGWFRKPPRLLKEGDVVAVSIDGVGDLVNPVIERLAARLADLPMDQG